MNVYRRVALSLDGKLHVVVVEATLPEVAKSFASSDGECAMCCACIPPFSRKVGYEMIRIARDRVRVRGAFLHSSKQ